MDIHKYKRRLTASELKISESNISQANKKIIFDFERQLFLKELSPGRIENYLFVLRQTSEKTNKNLDSLDKADVELVLEGMHRADLSAYTIRNYKTCLKGFFKLNGKTELANSIHVKKVEPRIPDILTREEVLTMIDVAWHPMDKALIAALYETGCRIGEMATLQIKNIHFDKHGAVLIIEKGKTGPRRVRAIFCVPYLSTWYDQHPNKLSPDASFWIVLDCTKKTFGLLPTYGTLSRRIKRIVKRANIQKHVHPHLFRHTSATEKSEILTEAQMNEFFGWRQGSSMSRTYVHLSGRNLDDTLFKAFGILKDNTPKEKDLAPIKCPRCETDNGVTAKFCQRCGAVLDIATAVNIDKQCESAVLDFMELVSEHPGMMSWFKKKMAENEAGSQPHATSHMIN